jgi:hypothetical protein
MPGRTTTSPFRTQVTFVLRAVLIALLVMVCMGIGWFLVNGRRPRSVAESSSVAKVAPIKKAKSDPETPRKKTPPQNTPPGENPGPVRPTPPPGRVLTYEKDIMPIMEKACISCHGALKKSGKLDLRTYQALRKGGAGGTGVVPGKPDASPLWTEIHSGTMPPPASKKKLSNGEKELVRAWIVGGAKSAR